MAKAYVPERGDLVWVEFTPQAGHEQAGRRPALVLSPRVYNAKSGLAVCCPITNQSKGYPFEVPLAPSGKTTGVVLVDQIRNIDWRARRATRIEAAPSEVVNEVLARIFVLLEPR